jgi:hypothetical protein
MGLSVQTTRTLILAIASAGAITLCTPAEATIVNIDGRSSVGTTLTLAAGTYSATYAGISGGGAYDAWNAWGQVGGCDGAGENCSEGWLNQFTIDFGGGHFDSYAALNPAQRVVGTAAQSLADYQAGPLLVSHDGAADVVGTIQFTLASAQSVQFLVEDTPYGDNLGGVSIDLSSNSAPGVPEPSTWALIVMGFGALGAALRARKPIVT